MKKYILFTLTIVFAILFSSCNQSTGIDFTSNKWKVVKLKKEGEPKFTFTEEDYILEFEKDSTFNLNLDVNNCMGKYDDSGEGSIQFEPLACTKACCDTEIAQDISMMLENMTKYAAEGNNKLILKGKGEMFLIKI